MPWEPRILYFVLIFEASYSILLVTISAFLKNSILQMFIIYGFWISYSGKG
jgi:hypothetical protein